MQQKKYDIIELMIKKELHIPLDIDEELWLDEIDDDLKETALMLIRSDSYKDEISKMADEFEIDISNLYDDNHHNTK